MNLLPPKAYRVWRWPFFCFVILNALFLVTGSSLSVKAQDWKATLEEGKTMRAFLEIENKCSQPHHFRVESDVKYVRFEESTVSIPIPPKTKKTLWAVIDTKGLKSEIHQDKFFWECIDCKEQKGCSADKNVVTIQLTVPDTTPEGKLASEYSRILYIELDNLGALVEDAAREKLDDIIRKSAATVIKSGQMDRIEESKENVKKLARALVEHGEKKADHSPGNSFAARSRWNAPVVITISSVKKALASVCPLFPFCK